LRLEESGGTGLRLHRAGGTGLRLIIHQEVLACAWLYIVPRPRDATFSKADDHIRL